jgi:hypothetical protein
MTDVETVVQRYGDRPVIQRIDDALRCSIAVGASRRNRFLARWTCTTTTSILRRPLLARRHPGRQFLCDNPVGDELAEAGAHLLAFLEVPIAP